MTRHNLAVYEGHVRNYICPDPARHVGSGRSLRTKDFDGGLGAIRLGQLTASKVSDFRDRLRDAGVSVPTTRKILGTLQLVLEYAIGRDLIAVNSARGVKVIGRRDEGSRKIVPPTKDAMRRLIEVADVDFRVELIVASATGMRAGELHALRWRHLDLMSGEVTVETRVDVYGDEDVTKTAAGMRTVPLGGPVIAVLKEWKMRSRHSKPDDLVFPNRQGGYANHDNMVKRQFLPLFERLAGPACGRTGEAPAGTRAVQLACAASFRGVVLDRGRARPEDDPDLRGPFQPSGDHGPLRAPLQIGRP